MTKLVPRKKQIYTEMWWELEWGLELYIVPICGEVQYYRCEPDGWSRSAFGRELRDLRQFAFIGEIK